MRQIGRFYNTVLGSVTQIESWFFTQKATEPRVCSGHVRRVPDCCVINNSQESNNLSKKDEMDDCSGSGCFNHQYSSSAFFFVGILLIFFCPLMIWYGIAVKNSFICSRPEKK